MKYKNIYVLLLIVAGSSVYAAEQPIQQEQIPRELIFKLFVKDSHDYTNQEALNALKALRETNKSFATDKGLQQAIDYMKNYNSLYPHLSNRKLYFKEITLIATLLGDQEWLRNNTESVDSLIFDIIRQHINRPRELSLLHVLQILWPLSSIKFNDSTYVILTQGPTRQDEFGHIACEIAKFLHKKNIPINNQTIGYCYALKEIIEKIKKANRYIKGRFRIDDQQKEIENYKILYKCLKDLGARLDPKCQAEAKELELE